MADQSKICRFDSYEQDFVQARNPDYQLPEDYPWVFERPWQKTGTWLCRTVFSFWAWFRLKKQLQIQVANAQIIQKEKGPAFLFLNHTQPTLDPFIPKLILEKRMFRSICAPANFSIPVIGRLLPLAGAIPTASSPKQLRKMKQAIQAAVDHHEWIVIYPEAHVWPWCSWIRPFSDASFQFCLDTGLPAWCGVLVYESRKGHKPGMQIRLAGPFEADPGLPHRKARRLLRDQVLAAMQQLAGGSQPVYVQYQPSETFWRTSTEDVCASGDRRPQDQTGSAA